jgi:hypothetical protein
MIGRTYLVMTSHNELLILELLRHITGARAAMAYIIHGSADAEILP